MLKVVLDNQVVYLLFIMEQDKCEELLDTDSENDISVDYCAVRS